MIIDAFVIYLLIGFILIIIYIKICRSLRKSRLALNDLQLLKKSNAQNSHSDSLSQKASSHTLNSIFADLNYGVSTYIDNYTNNLDNLCKIKNINGKIKPSFSSHSSFSSVKSINRGVDERNKLNISKTTINYLKPRRQLIYMLMCLIFTFYICILPSKIFLLVMYDLTRHMELISFYYLNINIRVLLLINSAVNPILYNCLSTKFRKCFKKLFGIYEKPQINLNFNYPMVPTNKKRTKNFSTLVSVDSGKINSFTIDLQKQINTNKDSPQKNKIINFKHDISEIAES